ncbi:MAG: alpha/beta hydrolase family protein [Adhaeribacter sp.]
MKLLPNIAFVLLLVFVNNLAGQGRRSVTAEQDICLGIANYFSPPAAYKGVYGNYRSPLKFYNGDSVRTAQDWKLRRKEILDKWHSFMGKWPAFITNQQMEVLETTPKTGYTQHKIRFSWTPTEKTVAYLLIPHAKGKKPAVITTYYEPETAIGLGKPDRDFALQLVKRGFVTLSIGTTETTKSQEYSLYYPAIENATVQPLSMLAYAAANAWYLLAKLPAVDSTRIGIMGHSYGGKWAMFASCLFEKFACAVWSDAGIVFDESKEAVNYWEPWYLGYHPKPWRKRGLITNNNPAKGLYLQLVAQGFDLHELHALMAPRPFLVSGGSEDPPQRWIPLNHTIRVNNLLGFKNRVALTNRPQHAPNPESNEQAFLFLECFLKKK